MTILERIAFKFGCAFKGIGIAVTTDNSFKTHIIFLILAVAAGVSLHFNLIEWALILFAIGLVFVAELFNTAIEFLVKMFTQDYHELAEKLLDISAGAVLFSTFTAVAVGLLIVIPKILQLFPG